MLLSGWFLLVGIVALLTRGGFGLRMEGEELLLQDYSGRRSDRRNGGLQQHQRHQFHRMQSGASTGTRNATSGISAKKIPAKTDGRRHDAQAKGGDEQFYRQGQEPVERQSSQKKVEMSDASPSNQPDNTARTALRSDHVEAHQVYAQAVLELAAHVYRRIGGEFQGEDGHDDVSDRASRLTVGGKSELTLVLFLMALTMGCMIGCFLLQKRTEGTRGTDLKEPKLIEKRPGTGHGWYDASVEADAKRTESENLKAVEAHPKTSAIGIEAEEKAREDDTPAPAPLGVESTADQSQPLTATRSTDREEKAREVIASVSQRPGGGPGAAESQPHTVMPSIGMEDNPNQIITSASHLVASEPEAVPPNPHTAMPSTGALGKTRETVTSTSQHVASEPEAAQSEPHGEDQKAKNVIDPVPHALEGKSDLAGSQPRTVTSCTEGGEETKEAEGPDAASEDRLATKEEPPAESGKVRVFPAFSAAKRNSVANSCFDHDWDLLQIGDLVSAEDKTEIDNALRPNYYWILSLYRRLSTYDIKASRLKDGEASFGVSKVHAMHLLGSDPGKGIDVLDPGDTDDLPVHKADILFQKASRIHPSVLGKDISPEGKEGKGRNLRKDIHIEKSGSSSLLRQQTSLPQVEFDTVGEKHSNVLARYQFVDFLIRVALTKFRSSPPGEAVSKFMELLNGISSKYTSDVKLLFEAGCTDVVEAVYQENRTLLRDAFKLSVSTAKSMTLEDWTKLIGDTKVTVLFPGFKHVDVPYAYRLGLDTHADEHFSSDFQRMTLLEFKRALGAMLFLSELRLNGVCASETLAQHLREYVERDLRHVVAERKRTGI